MPEQNNLKPPPDPVLSITGVLKEVDLPNSSATAVAKGKTVDEPTIRIWSRAACAVDAIDKLMRLVPMSARVDLFNMVISFRLYL